MGSQDEWFKHDASRLAKGKVRNLGLRYGPEGPLVDEAFQQYAKRQHNGGVVTVDWAELAEQAFVKTPARATQIVERMIDLKMLEVVEMDDLQVVVNVVGWEESQGNGVSGAERTAAWRHKKKNGDVTVTSHVRHSDGRGDEDVTQPSRASALAKEEELRETPNGVSSALPSKLERAEAKATPDDTRLCALLGHLIKARNEKFRVQSKAEWLDQMRLLREKDGNSPADIERLIQWVFTSQAKDAEFWAKTVQSTANLRENFPRVWGQMLAAGKPKGGPVVESSDDYLARRGAT